MQVRYDQKMAKYGRVAEQNNLRFIPAVFSHTGQIHGEFKALVKEQIRHKLIAFEGEAKCSKIRMKYVNTYFCKDFFLDELFIEENEITYKSPLFAIFNDNETKKKDKNSHVFAKLKNHQDPRKTEL